MIKETLQLLKTDDAQQIALWKINLTNQSSNQHIFLTHGTFSDKRICLGIAHYFAELGYTCWIMEWRNHGASPSTTVPFNFETIALLDIKAAFTYLVDELGLTNLSCITHSGGGICLTMFLIKYPEYCKSINSMIFFGCQAFGAADSFLKRQRIVGMKWMARLIGHIPGTKNGRPHDETYYTMEQWFDWNLTATFKGANDFDYLPLMKHLTIPILSVCGEGDKYIAPLIGSTAFLDAFENNKNELLVCGKKGGYLEDYDHGRILLSKGAAKEIWPKAKEWIILNEQ